MNAQEEIAALGNGQNVPAEVRPRLLGWVQRRLGYALALIADA
jgi:hypothetical protein